MLREVPSWFSVLDTKRRESQKGERDLLVPIKAPGAK